MFRHEARRLFCDATGTKFSAFIVYGLIVIEDLNTRYIKIIKSPFEKISIFITENFLSIVEKYTSIRFLYDINAEIYT